MNTIVFLQTFLKTLKSKLVIFITYRNYEIEYSSKLSFKTINGVAFLGFQRADNDLPKCVQL